MSSFLGDVIFKPGDEPAFPSPHELQLGLTKREYFAAMAMQGLLAKEDSSFHVGQLAVHYADELIAELAKPKAEPK